MRNAAYRRARAKRAGAGRRKSSGRQTKRRRVISARAAARGNGGTARTKRKHAARFFNALLWTTSMAMIISLLPADSNIAGMLGNITQDNSVLTSAVSVLSDAVSMSKDAAAGLQESKNSDSKSSDIIVLSEPATDDEGDEDDENGTDSENSNETGGTNAEESTTPVVDTSKITKNGSGNIIIYHTHATEAYLPAASANAHTTELASTVREGAETLSAELEARGYSIVHDMTLHDYPSYNKSYNRSLETVKKLCASYSNKKLVIDYHRDAATSSGKAKTATIGGETVASFCLVVGTKNDNYKTIRSLAEKITEKANEMYPGFARSIVEKPYKFNGYVSDCYILLEVGNNANTIDQVNAAMPYLANVFAEVVG